MGLSSDFEETSPYIELVQQSNLPWHSSLDTERWDEVHDIAQMQVGFLQPYVRIIENLIVERLVVILRV